MKKDLRQWLDETLATRPQSVAVPDQTIRNRTLDKLSNELWQAGYRRYGGHGHADAWIYELPHPAHELKALTLKPFSIFDRRVRWDRATGKAIQIGPWLPNYFSLTLHTDLDEPSGKSYSRPSNRTSSPRQIEASHQARYFEDIDDHPVFGERALIAPNLGWCLVEASSEEVIRGAHPDGKRELDDGTAFSLRPMKGYWLVENYSDDAFCQKLLSKFGLTDVRTLNPRGEIEPADLWAFNLWEDWFRAHGPNVWSWLSPLDSEEAYSRDFLMRPSNKTLGERIAQRVAEGPPNQRQTEDENWETAPDPTTSNQSSRAAPDDVGAASTEEEGDWMLQLERLGNLFERGLLSEDEFETQKQRLLRQSEKPH